MLTESMESPPQKRAEPVEPSDSKFKRIDASNKNQLNYQDAIFRVFAPQIKGENAGSGFFYTPKGNFLTDLHVVGDASTVKIKTNNGSQLIGIIDRRDKDNDLAAGHVLSPASELPFLIFEDPSILPQDNSVARVAGYPYGQEFTVVTGKFGKPAAVGFVAEGELESGENPMRQVFTTNTYSHRAMSGGVVLNEDYLLVGVIDKGNIFKGKDSTTIVTPVADCLKLIRQLK